MFKVKCDVHPWMGAFVHVLDHPFFSVTGDDGTFTISGLPPGNYTVTAWHETLGEQQQADVKVEEGKPGGGGVQLRSEVTKVARASCPWPRYSAASAAQRTR